MTGPAKELFERARCRVAGASLRKRLNDLLTRPITRPSGFPVPQDPRIGPFPPPPPIGAGMWAPWFVGSWSNPLGPMSAGPQPEPPTTPDLDPEQYADAWRAMSGFLRDLADLLGREIEEVRA